MPLSALPLPHGPEFRFVHKLLHLEPGVSAVAEFTLPEDAHFLKGHFPGNPMMPGVLMIEAVAQLAGVVAQCDPQHPVLADMKLTAIKSAKILGSFGPGETVQVFAKILGRLDNLIQAEGSIQSQGSEILKTQVTLAGTALR